MTGYIMCHTQGSFAFQEGGDGLLLWFLEDTVIRNNLVNLVPGDGK